MDGLEIVGLTSLIKPGSIPPAMIGFLTALHIL